MLFGDLLSRTVFKFVRKVPVIFHGPKQSSEIEIEVTKLSACQL